MKKKETPPPPPPPPPKKVITDTHYGLRMEKQKTNLNFQNYFNMKRSLAILFFLSMAIWTMVALYNRCVGNAPAEKSFSLITIQTNPDSTRTARVFCDDCPPKAVIARRLRVDSVVTFKKNLTGVSPND